MARAQQSYNGYRAPGATWLHPSRAEIVYISLDRWGLLCAVRHLSKNYSTALMERSSHLSS